ncbi:Similar to Poly [ADP-ribose] polymerase (Sarcophaga peregrina) [Cotesia congregata]|uniref:Poly [ADP-ribose] polymerase n=1 Tax=Cotesia congregata TaxID=51543 RepID=A0A8J2MHX4_COTCN|nr:Similar to Poly [ADP-ribose] polymerase (Sarcophaga peregrina) [Cotesia congregata]
MEMNAGNARIPRRVYENGNQQYSMIDFAKSKYDRSLVHKYQVEIWHGKQENKYILYRSWGTSKAHIKYEKKKHWSLETCLVKFKLFVSAKIKKLIFATLDANYRPCQVPLPIQCLLKDILDVNIIQKISKIYDIDEELSVPEDLKINLVMEFMNEDVEFQLINKSDRKLFRNPMNVYYKNLHTTIEILDKKSPRFKMIEKYVKNTHAITHDHYSIKIDNVFLVQPHDIKKYKKNLRNKKLLWHGTIKTKISSILANGLQLPDPSERGLMFGPGIYFSNCVSNAANYCNTDAKVPNGVLLLCEVALGTMLEKFRAENDLVKLPDDKHSVFSRGVLTPEPTEVTIIPQNVEVPYGKLVTVDLARSAKLRHDEFIVYDPNQIKIRYMLTVHFEYV